MTAAEAGLASGAAQSQPSTGLWTNSGARVDNSLPTSAASEDARGMIAKAQQAAVEAILPSALRLTVAVTDHDADAVKAVLEPLTRDQLYALAITLAAHVDLDRPMTGDLPMPLTPDRAMNQAVHLAAEAFCVQVDAVLSASRHRPVLDARAVAMAALRICGYSSPAIGAAFDRDHSTVLHAEGRVGADRRLYAIARRIAVQCGWQRLGVEAEAS